MRKISFLGVGFALSLFLQVSAGAGEMTAGLVLQGGENALSTFRLTRVQSDQADVLRLRLDLTDGQALKGYGAVVHFDPMRYTFVEAKQVPNHVLDTGDGVPGLFISSNNQPGQVALGAMNVNGQTGRGEGGLVELAFEMQGQPRETDFQISDGVLVDLSGKLNAVNRVDVGAFDLKPAVFDLEQNKPNPFNPSTTIAFQLPEAGKVTLSIYNILGQEVQRLVNDFRDAGRHTVVWNGKDELGRQVASGLYVYRLESTAGVQTRRMMLLK